MSSLSLFPNEEKQVIHFLNQSKYTKIILLADAKTNGFCLPTVKKIFPQLQNTLSIVIPDGEVNKNLSICELIWNALMELQAEKNTLLVAVGGGMLSDIGGFVASTYKRGIDFMVIPTTLLAMVDASHGGKNGVDFNGYKNAIGNNYPPKLIYVNPVFLFTLSERTLRSGIAEMLKHSLLADESTFAQILNFEKTDFYQISNIRDSIQIKNNIVNQDVMDIGIRQTLNAGHSIGHAIESFSFSTASPLLHGEAVMLGLIYELAISHILFDFPLSTIQRLIRFKQKIFTDLNFSFSYQDIEKYLGQDKKNTSGIKMSLLQTIGNCKWQVSVSTQVIEKAIEKANLFMLQQSKS